MCKIWTILVGVVVSPESRLKIGNHILVQLEGLCQNISWYCWLWSKHCICNSDHAWVLATQWSNGHCVCCSHIELEVNENLWEDENVSLVKDPGDEAVLRIRGEKAHIKCPFQDNEDLCGSRVDVGRVKTIWRIINLSQGNAKGVESRYLCHVCWCDHGPKFVWCISWNTKPWKGEIIWSRKLWIFAEFPIHKHWKATNILGLMHPWKDQCIGYRMNVKWTRRVERGHDYYTSGVCIVNSYTEVLTRTGIGGRGNRKCHSGVCKWNWILNLN